MPEQTQVLRIILTTQDSLVSTNPPSARILHRVTPKLGSNCPKRFDDGFVTQKNPIRIQYSQSTVYVPGSLLPQVSYQYPVSRQRTSSDNPTSNI